MPFGTLLNSAADYVSAGDIRAGDNSWVRLAQKHGWLDDDDLLES